MLIQNLSEPLLDAVLPNRIVGEDGEEFGRHSGTRRPPPPAFLSASSKSCSLTAPYKQFLSFTCPLNWRTLITPVWAIQYAGPSLAALCVSALGRWTSAGGRIFRLTRQRTLDSMELSNTI